MADRKPLETEPYKGVRDFYPKDWAVLSTVFDMTRSVLTHRGYEEYQASPLERSEMYESKGNEEIIDEQTYTFEDRGGRRVTLRPEMTPTLARMVAGKRREVAFPLRWFSIGNRFRYERPQRGRLREFFQTDIDLVGAAEGEADIEIIMLAHEILTAYGATDADFVIRVNSRKLLSAACAAANLSDEEGVREYWRLLDRKAKMSAAEFDAARGEGLDPLRAIEEATDEAVRTEKEKLMTLIETLKSRGVGNVVFEPEIVRGFDYYTGVVFEVNDTNPENPRALFGGGRYDGLVAMFGGDPIPAVGFAFGDVTLVDFLTTHNLLPVAHTAPELFIATPEIDDIKEAQALARTLTCRTFVNITEKKLSDQLRDANKRSIPYVIVYGKEERERGLVKLKNMETGEEQEAQVGELSALVTA